MSNSFKECRCGRRIPTEWRVCATCEQIARLDALDGGAEHRQYRFHALRLANFNRDVEPPLGPEFLAQLAEGISRRVQEDSLMGLRIASRQLQDTRIKIRYS